MVMRSGRACWWQFALVAMLFGCAAPKGLPEDKQAAKGLGLLQGRERIVKGVSFLDCVYGTPRSHNPNALIRAISDGSKGTTVVTFWNANQIPTADSVLQVSPGGSGTFIRRPYRQCPADLSRVMTMLEDWTPGALPEGPEDDGSTGSSLVNVERLRNDVTAMHMEVGSGQVSFSAALRRIGHDHAPGLRRLATIARPATADYDGVVEGRVKFPVRPIADMSKHAADTLVVLRRFVESNFVGGMPETVSRQWEPLRRLDDDIRAASRDTQRVLAEWSRRGAEEDRRLAALAREERRRNSCTGMSGAPTPGSAEPSELQMCEAIVAELRSNAEGFEKSVSMIGELMGRWIEDVIRYQGTDIEGRLVGFRKNGSCRQDTGDSGREGWVCRHDGNVLFQGSQILRNLQEAGIPGLERESFFWRDSGGVWHQDATREQASAIRRIAAGQAEQDREREERRVRARDDCRQRNLMNGRYWTCGF